MAENAQSRKSSPVPSLSGLCLFRAAVDYNYRKPKLPIRLNALQPVKLSALNNDGFNARILDSHPLMAVVVVAVMAILMMRNC